MKLFLPTTGLLLSIHVLARPQAPPLLPAFRSIPPIQPSRAISRLAPGLGAPNAINAISSDSDSSLPHPNLDSAASISSQRSPDTDTARAKETSRITTSVLPANYFGYTLQPAAIAVRARRDLAIELFNYIQDYILAQPQNVNVGHIRERVQGIPGGENYFFTVFPAPADGGRFEWGELLDALQWMRMQFLGEVGDRGEGNGDGDDLVDLSPNVDVLRGGGSLGNSFVAMVYWSKEIGTRTGTGGLKTLEE